MIAPSGLCRRLRVVVSELVPKTRGLFMRLMTTVGLRSPLAEYETSEPPSEKLT